MPLGQLSAQTSCKWASPKKIEQLKFKIWCRIWWKTLKKKGHLVERQAQKKKCSFRNYFPSGVHIHLSSWTSWPTLFSVSLFWHKKIYNTITQPFVTWPKGFSRENGLWMTLSFPLQHWLSVMLASATLV